MKTDIQIAQEAEMKHIKEVAVQAGISEDELEFYGKDTANIPLNSGTDSKITRMESLYLYQQSSLLRPERVRLQHL